MSLDRRTLNFFVEIDGKKTVAEIGGKLGIGAAEMLPIVDKLMKLKLIEPLQPSVALVDDDFMAYLRRHLSMAIGPIAGVILEDAMADLGIASEAVPAHQAAELVELLAREIQREEPRIEFKQRMVKLIVQKGYSA